MTPADLVGRCQHDHDVKVWSEPAVRISRFDTRVRQDHAYCERCGALLYTDKVWEARTEREVKDPVYDALYTADGRAALLRAALVDAGVRIPHAWGEYGTIP